MQTAATLNGEAFTYESCTDVDCCSIVLEYVDVDVLVGVSSLYGCEEGIDATSNIVEDETELSDKQQSSTNEKDMIIEFMLPLLFISQQLACGLVIGIGTLMVVSFSGIRLTRPKAQLGTQVLTNTTMTYI